MVARSGSARPGSYTGSRGPRQFSQIAVGAAARSVPQLRQRSGRAVSGGEAMGVGMWEPQQKKPGNNCRGGALFSTLFNVAAIRGKSPRGGDCLPKDSSGLLNEIG